MFETFKVVCFKLVPVVPEQVASFVARVDHEMNMTAGVCTGWEMTMLHYGPEVTGRQPPPPTLHPVGIHQQLLLLLSSPGGSSVSLRASLHKNIQTTYIIAFTRRFV